MNVYDKKNLLVLILMSVLFGLFGCAPSQVTKKSIFSDGHVVHLEEHKLNIPNGFIHVNTDDVPPVVKDFVKKLKTYFPKGIYNPNTGTIILLGFLEKSDENKVASLQEKIKKMKDQDELQAFLSQLIPENAAWLNLKHIRLMDSGESSSIGADIEAAFMETRFVIGWTHGETDFTNDAKLTCLCLFRPNASKTAMRNYSAVLQQ